MLGHWWQKGNGSARTTRITGHAAGPTAGRGVAGAALDGVQAVSPGGDASGRRRWADAQRGARRSPLRMPQALRQYP